MLVRNIQLYTAENEQTLSAQIDFESIERPTYELFYTFPREVSVSNRGDVFVAACLFPSMALHERLIIEAPVSEKLFKACVKIQDIFSHWVKGCQRINIEAPVDIPSIESKNLIGCYFSMGVDSFYTYLKQSQNEESLPDTLIYVFGFDVKLSNITLLANIKAHLEQVAKAFNRRLLIVKSNIRPFGDIRIDWGYHFHGSALASVGLALSPTFKTIYIPASTTYSSVRPWGSNPLLDPLWANELTTFDHDGCDADRHEKITSLVSRSDIALEHLRVCYLNPDNNYNCGECEKCVRTMLSLYGAGVLEKAKSFKTKLTPKLIRKIKLDSPARARYAFRNLQLLEALPKTKHNKALAKTLRLKIALSRIKFLWNEYFSDPY